MKTPRDARNLAPALSAIALTLLLAAIANPAFAHCDTLDGPVVAAARLALEEQDVTPVLKWVLPGQEAEVREAFTRALIVRKDGGEARELADRWFFENLVRLHREGEGFPYTGLVPAGTPVEPVIAAADRALEVGSGEELTDHLATAVAKGVETRFREALEAKEHAGDSVEAGREFVAAYVDFTHYVEAVGALAAAHGSAHGTSASDHGHD